MGNLTVPFEAKITMNPVAGEVLDYPTATTYTNCGNGSSKINNANFHFTYKTLQHYSTFGVWSDVWRTALEEYVPGTSQIQLTVNYAFANNIGLVDFWYCQYVNGVQSNCHEFYLN